MLYQIKQFAGAPTRVYLTEPHLLVDDCLIGSPGARVRTSKLPLILFLAALFEASGPLTLVPRMGMRGSSGYDKSLS